MNQPLTTFLGLPMPTQAEMEMMERIAKEAQQVCPLLNPADMERAAAFNAQMREQMEQAGPFMELFKQTAASAVVSAWVLQTSTGRH